MSSKLVGNLAMSASKICSGLNQNALRYLQPAWIDAFSGVFMRLAFAGTIFWLIGCFKKSTAVSLHDKCLMLLIGIIFVYGYMLGLLLSLTYSTPVSSSLILCTEPVWVLLMSAFFFHERITKNKVLGIALGMAGCLVCILTQKASAVATNPLLGNLCCIISAILYSAYIVASKSFLKRIDDITFNKWVFLGGALSAIASIFFNGFYAPALNQGLFSTPMLALLFVLIFPSTVSYFLMAIGLENLPATAVAMYGYVILIVTMTTSYLLGQDTFSWYQGIAVILIVFSVYLVEIAGTSKQKSANKN